MSSPRSASTIDTRRQPFLVRLLILLSQISLLGTVAVSPWLLGGVATRDQYYLFVGVTLALVLWIPAALYQSVTSGICVNRISYVILPLLGMVLLGRHQIAESSHLPSVESISTAIRSATESSNSESARRSIIKSDLIRLMNFGGSIAPVVTRLEMAKLSIAIVAFVLAMQLFANSASQRMLFTVLGFNGAALAFLGICQSLSGNGKAMWFFPHLQAGNPFSTFVNRNNAAGYLCLCLSAAIGLLVFVFSKGPLSRDAHVLPRSKTRAVPKARRNVLVSSRDFIRELTTEQLLAMTAIVAIVSGIITAMSRGGWLALACGALVVCLGAIIRGRIQAVAIILALGFVSTTLIVWLGLADQIIERVKFEKVLNQIAHDGRWTQWKDSLNVVADFPMTGTGFGTYQFAYLPYQSTSAFSHLRFYNADNQFLEWLVEGGAVGVALVAVTILLLVLTCLALLIQAPSEPAGLVALFAISSQCVSAFFDFGPTMPANMLALAVIFGAITGRYCYLAGAKFIRALRWLLSTPGFKPSLIFPCAGIALLFPCFQSLKTYASAAQVHQVSHYLPKLDRADSLPEEVVDRSIAELAAAIEKYPGDPDAHIALANLRTHRFRLQEYRKLTENAPKNTETWLRTDPALMYFTINRWENSGQIERTEMLLEQSPVKDDLAPALEQLHLAQAACPWVPDASRLAATLGFVSDARNPADETNLRWAIFLAPANPAALYQVGQLADFAEIENLAFDSWKRSLEFSPQFLPEIHRSVAQQMPLEEELTRVIPEMPDVVLRLAVNYTSPSAEDDRRLIANRALEIASAKAFDGSAEAERRHAMGVARNLLSEPDAAIEEFHRALELQPSNIEWRLELIQIIYLAKGVHAALLEADVCLSLFPGENRIEAIVRGLRNKAAQDHASPVRAGKTGKSR